MLVDWRAGEGTEIPELVSMLHVKQAFLAPVPVDSSLIL